MVGRVCGMRLRVDGISQVCERSVVGSQGCSSGMASLMMVIVVGVVVAVECRAPALSQRQSRLRKADELTLPFRLAGPARSAGAPLETHLRE